MQCDRVAVLAGAVAAPLDIPGFVFPPTAGADVATIVAGSDPSFYLCGATSDDGAPTLPGLTVEESAKRVFTDGTADAELLGRAVVDIAFVDNIVVNRAGPDLIVFESGQPEAFAVVVVDPVTRVFTAPRTFTPVPTGSVDGCGFQLNAAQIDLTDFGIEPGAARSQIRMDNLGSQAGCCGGADLSDVFALNSSPPVPEPPPPAPPLPLTLRGSAPVAVPARPVAGKAFAVRIAVIRGDTGAPLPSGTAACTVRLGLKMLVAVGRVRAGGLAACTMVIPKSARGKRLHGTIKVTFRNVSVAKSFSYTVL